MPDLPIPSYDDSSGVFGYQLTKPLPVSTIQTGPFFTDAQIAAPYRQYDVEVYYLYDSGNLQLPVGAAEDGSEQPCVIIPVSSPAGVRVVEFNLSRYGCECVAPDATPDVGETLMSAVVKSVPPNPSSDANAGEWKMSGRYVFALSVPGADLNQATNPTISPSSG